MCSLLHCLNLCCLSCYDIDSVVHALKKKLISIEYILVKHYLQALDAARIPEAGRQQLFQSKTVFLIRLTSDRSVIIAHSCR